MAESTFDSTNIGYLQLQDGEDTPRLVQKQRFAGIGGATVLDHGKMERQLSYITMVTGTDIDNWNSKKAAIKAKQNTVGTIVQQMGGTTESHTYCRLDRVQPVGNFGYVGTAVRRRMRLTFTQLVW